MQFLKNFKEMFVYNYFWPKLVSGRFEEILTSAYILKTLIMPLGKVYALSRPCNSFLCLDSPIFLRQKA